MTIRQLENGWEEYSVTLCRECSLRLYEPGNADLALMVLIDGSCGHPYPGTP